jgi:lipoate-protein ligase A
MILWRDGAHDPAENMRRDSGLLEAAEADPAAEPVLRLFGFSPPGITLGRGQDPERALDLARCRRDGVPWAIRPTGGRAIFHDAEWTYSFTTPLAHRWGAGGAGEAYARVSTLIVRSLERLGVPATLARGARAADFSGAAPAPCFASTARHEIVLAGRKLVGSAQRRTARALLQQGSVLLGDGHLRLAEYLPGSPDQRAAARAALAHVATHAGAWLAGPPELERWAAAIAAELPEPPRRIDAQAGLALIEPALSAS